jgi:hypothetical protein
MRTMVVLGLMWVSPQQSLTRSCVQGYLGNTSGRSKECQEWDRTIQEYRIKVASISNEGLTQLRPLRVYRMPCRILHPKGEGWRNYSPALAHPRLRTATRMLTLLQFVLVSQTDLATSSSFGDNAGQKADWHTVCLRRITQLEPEITQNCLPQQWLKQQCSKGTVTPSIKSTGCIIYFKAL